jgi:hypothetical protein
MVDRGAVSQEDVDALCALMDDRATLAVQLLEHATWARRRGCCDG